MANTPRLSFRKRKETLTCFVGFAGSPPSDDYVTALSECIAALPAAAADKEVLFAFFFGPDPAKENVVASLRREDEFRALL